MKFKAALSSFKALPLISVIFGSIAQAFTSVPISWEQETDEMNALDRQHS